MSRVCAVCNRGPKKSVSRSHSNIATLRKLYPNLQTKKIEGKKEKVCTTCIRTMNKNKVE